MGHVGLSRLGVKHLILLLHLPVHLVFISLVGMCKLSSNIMIDNVLVIVNVFLGPPGPDEEHAQRPY